MKKILIYSLLCTLTFACSNVCVAQNNESKTEPLFTISEVDAEFPGGKDSLTAFINRNLVYPNNEANIQGVVLLTFIVEKDGSITDIKVLRDIGGDCGKEAVRVVKLMPKWKPATQRGKPVRKIMNLQFRFRLPLDPKQQ